MSIIINDTDHRVFFQASEIQAYFPDDQIITYSSDDIRVETRPQGRDVLVFQQQQAEGEGGEGDHVVRLYLIPPQQDWRSNANYTWSLSMGWMSNRNSNNKKKDDGGWLFWNKENNVQSQIQAFSGKELFSTDSITLHFESMSRFPWSHHKSLLPKVPNTKIVMKDVLLGAHLEDDGNNAPGRHRPCQSTVCDIVDGVIGSESMMMLGIIPTSGAPIDLLRLVLIVPALVVLIGLIRCLLQQQQGGGQSRKQKYSPIDETDNGQELETMNED